MEKATYLQSNMADKYQLKKCSYVFRGNFVHSTSENALEILPDKILGISPSGKVNMLACCSIRKKYVIFEFELQHKYSVANAGRGITRYSISSTEFII